MTGRSCGICGSATSHDAHYCADCGAPLDATVVDLTSDSAGPQRGGGWAGDRSTIGFDPPGASARPGAETFGSSRPMRRIVALALVAGAVAIGAAALAGGPEEDATGPRPAPTVDRTLPNDAPRPIPTPTPAVNATATPRPESAPVAPPAPIDPGDVPPMDATHLASIDAGGVAFLDLDTGIWSRATGWSAEPVAAHAVRGGVVVQGSGSWAFAGTAGGDVTMLPGDGSGFGLAGEDLLVTADFDAAGGLLEARRFDGTVNWTTALPIGAWPVALSNRGEVIVQVGERIVALDHTTGAPRVVATGSAVTTFDDTVVFWSCDARLRCATKQRDLRSSVTSVVSDSQWYFVSTGPGRFVGYPQAGSERESRAFAVVDGVLTEMGDPVPVDVTGGVVDAAGVVVEIGLDTIRFTTPDGGVTTIPSPPGAGPDTILRLVTTG